MCVLTNIHILMYRSYQLLSQLNEGIHHTLSWESTLPAPGDTNTLSDY